MNFDILWQFLIVALVCYIVGNFNVARYFSRINKKDITKQGSGNPGAMNMLRNYGFKLGAITLLLDVLKGAVPVLAAYFIFRYRAKPADLDLDYGLIAMFVAAITVVLGHVYPVIQRFKGGKGVSCTLGVYFTITSVIGFWYVGLIVFALGALYIILFEWGSIGSLIMTTLLPAFTIIYFVLILKCKMSGYLIFIICVNIVLCLLSYWKHRSNLKKLSMGKESRTSIKKVFSIDRKQKKETQNASEENDTENKDVS